MPNSVFYIENSRLDRGLINIAAAGAIYHKEITRAMKVAQTSNPESFVPPEWFKASGVMIFVTNIFFRNFKIQLSNKVSF